MELSTCTTLRYQLRAKPVLTASTRCPFVYKAVVAKASNTFRTMFYMRFPTRPILGRPSAEGYKPCSIWSKLSLITALKWLH